MVALDRSGFVRTDRQGRYSIEAPDKAPAAGRGGCGVAGGDGSLATVLSLLAVWRRRARR